MIWTREELKSRAKQNLSYYLWTALAVSLIYVFVSNYSGGGASVDSGNYLDNRFQNTVSELRRFSHPSIGNFLRGNERMNVRNIIPREVRSVFHIYRGSLRGGILSGVVYTFWIINLAAAIFIVPVLEVGRNRFYMESRGMKQSAGIEIILWGFTHNYINIVLTMFLRNLLVAVGTIFCLFPGVYLGYCFYMVPYILSENPEMGPTDVLSMSSKMMSGHKLDSWVLQLSFIGWALLCIMTCGFGFLFLRPYYTATFAELYAVLRRDFRDRLSGFGDTEVIPPGEADGTYVGPGGY